MLEISFHGLTAGSFDRITQIAGSFEQCLRGIRLLLERKLPVTLKSLGMTLNRDEILEIKALAKRFGANVHYKFGAEMRPRLDGSEEPFDLQLSKDEIRAIEGADAEMREERKQQDETERTGPRQCGGGRFSFHIDAYGRLALCSNNRRQGYDLRTGSFREGFYESLPGFPCPLRP